MKIVAAFLVLLLPQGAPDPDAAQKERVDVLCKTVRRSTVSLQGRPLVQAARAVFHDGFGVSSRFVELDDDAALRTVDLELKDVSFWEAVDRFAAKSGFSHQIDEDSDGEPLVLHEFGRDLHGQTFGELRLFARLSLVNPRNYRIDLFVAAPFWAAPSQAVIEAVALDGKPAGETRSPAPVTLRPAATEKRLSVSGTWRSGSLPMGATVAIEGTLRVIPSGAKEETSIRFSFPKVPIPHPR